MLKQRQQVRNNKRTDEPTNNTILMCPTCGSIKLKQGKHMVFRCSDCGSKYPIEQLTAVMVP